MAKTRSPSTNDQQLHLERNSYLRDIATMATMGIEVHTFTVIARCQQTSMLGIAMATSSPAVGSRCPLIKPGVGAISHQAVSQPRLGMLAMKLLELGHTAAGVLKELKATDPYIEYRQIGVIEANGHVAVMTGKKNHPWAGHQKGKDYIVMGNCLSGKKVIEAMASAFESSTDESLEERLLRAIEAGRDAGGQPDGQSSACLLTYDRQPFARVDLRVDVHEEPVAELRRVFDWFAPLIPYYEMRAVAPTVPRFKDWLREQGIER